MDQHWLTVIIVLLIVGIVFDGVRRMHKARRDSIKMALKPVKKNEEEPDTESSDTYGSEFPNGGARVTGRQIDPDRIKQVRNKYNFGSDMNAWRDKVAEKIAEHTGINKAAVDANEKKAPRIEPSLEGADPLLDKASPVEDAAPDFVETHVSDEAEPQAQFQAGEQGTPIVAERREQGEQNTAKQTIDSEPVQESLNLEESVPMLMDSLGDGAKGQDDPETPEYEVVDHEESDLALETDKIVSVASQIDPALEEERVLESHSANKPRYESKYTDHAKHQVAAPQEVLVIHVRAAEGKFFYGNDLLELILANGLRFGDMNIFHRHAGEDGEGPILFSMANMVKPGVFDLHVFEEFSTVGLSFFLGLPTETGADMDTFDVMLATAKDIAEKLQGELKDENRSVLTKQTIEHYRERIRDFARRQQLEKNKP